VNQTSLGLLSTSTYGAIGRYIAAYPQVTHIGKRRLPLMLEQRIEWLANLCQLEPVSIRLIRALAGEDAPIPLGVLVERLGLPAHEVAIFATARSPIRDWGLVRVIAEPEPALKLNERIRRFLQAEPLPGEQNAIALCKIQLVRKSVVPASRAERGELLP
jgi:hypothetical protein